MTIHTDAVFEHGVLRPLAPVDLKEHSAASGRNRIAFDIGDISGRRLRVIVVPIQDGHHAGNQPRSGDIVGPGAR
jgi:hypothetical protein